jgi:hypothetical protein
MQMTWTFRMSQRPANGTQLNTASAKDEIEEKMLHTIHGGQQPLFVDKSRISTNAGVLQKCTIF